MTVNRSQKKAVRDFKAEHRVSYQEALRLSNLREIETVIRDDRGIEYTLWIEGSNLELIWSISESESAAAVGKLWQWMGNEAPDGILSDPTRNFYGSDGRVRAVAGSPSLWPSMPWVPAAVAAEVRSRISRLAPNWEKVDQSDLDTIRFLEDRAKPQM